MSQAWAMSTLQAEHLLRSLVNLPMPTNSFPQNLRCYINRLAAFNIIDACIIERRVLKS